MYEQTVFGHITDDGTATGSEDLNVNGSVTPVEFWTTAEKYGARNLKIKRITVKYEGSGSWKATTFGPLSALTNGCLVQITDADDNVLYNITLDEPVKQNGDWGAMLCNISYDGVTSGKDIFVGTWHHMSDGITVDLSGGQKLKATVRDNLSSLTHFHIFYRATAVYE